MSNVIMYFRTKNGAILPYSPRLLKNPSVTLVTEREAFPEKFAPVNLEAWEKKVDINVPKEAAEPPPYVAPELIADASRGFNTPKATKVRRKDTTNAAPPSFDGLGLGDF